VSSFAMCVKVSQLLHFVVGIFGYIVLFCLFMVIITCDECKLAFECGVNNGHSIDFVQSWIEVTSWEVENPLCLNLFFHLAW
jgi:hypothetical protein